MSNLDGLYEEMVEVGDLLVRALANEQNATGSFAENPFDARLAAQWAESRDLAEQLTRDYARAVQTFRDSARTRPMLG